MLSCPKCSSRDIIGPFFRRNNFGHESLVYRCGRCGYTEYGPCHDAGKEEDRHGFPKRPSNWTNADWKNWQDNMLPYSRSIRRRLDVQTGAPEWTDSNKNRSLSL